MASPPFYIPFAHWRTAPFCPPNSTVTIARFLTDYLILGLSHGQLLVFSTAATPGTTTLPRAHLSGHKSRLVALEPLLVRTETREEQVLLSLDSGGGLCKWSLADGRCVQAVHSTVASRPRGLRVVKKQKQKADARDPVVVVYGASTEVLVLNAETLEAVLLWTGNVNWPLLVVSGRGRILTLLPDGQAQGWGLDSRGGGTTGEDGGGGRAVLAIERDHTRRFFVEKREEWGPVKAFERVSEKGYVVIQSGGVTAFAAEDSRFVLREAVAVEWERGLSGFQVVPKKGADRGLVLLWSDDGESVVFELGEDSSFQQTIGIPAGFMKDAGMRATAMAFTRLEGGKCAIVALSQRKLQPGIQLEAAAEPQASFAVGVFSTKNAGSDIEWTENSEVFTPTSLSQGEIPSSCSAIFANMIATAHGPDVRFHSLSSFLLSYSDPIKEIHVPTAARICLLKRVRVGEYIAVGKEAGVQGGKEYLIVGTCSGELFTIEAPSFQLSKRLPISPTAVVSANLLPSNLGKRLRFTLLASSEDGTASIVDMERTRIMVTLPSHDYCSLVSFATKTGQNMVLLTYEDRVQREWDLGEEDGGVLRAPPPSRGSDRARGRTMGGSRESDLSEEGWREVRVGAFELVEEDREDEGDDANGDGTMKDCERLCEQGLPTAAINLRAALDALNAATKIAKGRTRESERRVVGNHPALISAKSLLTSLVPGGVEELMGWDEEEDDYEWREPVRALFFKRKKPAVFGQMGAGKTVSILSENVVNGSEDGVCGVSPTVSACILLAALATIGALFEAGGKDDDLFSTVVERALARLAAVKHAPALGVFAKYWMDGNAIIQKTARKCLAICVKSLSAERRENTVAYWERFLPVQVPPELFSSKEVVRSVIILGQLMIDHPDNVETSLKKSVALSVELLLGDSNNSFQDTAIELVGHGWTTFQSLFDPFEVIHILIRISASTLDDLSEARRRTLHKCLLEVAEKNSPLLGSGLANNISYGSSSSQPSALASANFTEALGVSIAAMRIVTMIVCEDAVLFRDVLGLIVSAVVKILDPNGGLRERVMPTATELISEMVEAYPTIAFHRPTQRLALSVSPGIIMIYDLKTSSELNVLQGHHNLANFLSFPVDGKFLVAVDLEECMFFAWKFATGLLSFIGGGSDGVPAVLMPKRREPFKNERKVGAVDIEWITERNVKVTAGGEVTVFQNLDSAQGGGSWNIL